MSFRNRESFTNSQRVIGLGLLALTAALVSYSNYLPLNTNKKDYNRYGRPDGAYITSSWQESDRLMDYINKLRANRGLKSLRWDDRAYSLAVARAKDMDQNEYAALTNPKTGQCAKTLKTQFGFTGKESVFESHMYYYFLDGINTAKADPMTMEMVLNQFINDKNFKTKEWILEEYHQAGAVGCSGSVCAIIFSNTTHLQGECEKG